MCCGARLPTIVCYLLTLIFWSADASRNLLYQDTFSQKLQDNGAVLSSFQADEALARQNSDDDESPVSHPDFATPSSWLLPVHLRPELAYFDAESGVNWYDDESYEAKIAVTWADVFAAERPGNGLRLAGQCKLLRVGDGIEERGRGEQGSSSSSSSNGPAAIHFDGVSCFAAQQYDDYLEQQPAWEAAAAAAVAAAGRSPVTATAVWIVRRDDASSVKAKSPFSFEGMLLPCLGTPDAAESITGGGLQPPPCGHWTLEALSQRRDALPMVAPAAAAGNVTAGYIRYGMSSGLQSAWRVRPGPCELLPPNLAIGIDISGEHTELFSGDVAVVLLYSRALQEDEVLQLAEFYGPRFGWGR